MAARANPTEVALKKVLLETANATGGWGYYAAKTSRIEPTCWALLALARDGVASDQLEVHRRFLMSLQQPSGLLAEDPALPINLAFNGLAAITLLHERRSVPESAIAKLLGALMGHPGLQFGDSPNFRQNNQLRGWPWIDGTFSWIEPTCWGMLALKVAHGIGLAPDGWQARVNEAEQLLIDRVCLQGGWNSGNSNAFGRDLYPYIPTTTLALLAMQDRRTEPAVIRSLEFLQRHWSGEMSMMGLALTWICFRRYEVPTDPVEAQLAKQLSTALSLGNLHALAAGLYATSRNSDETAFRL